jgi:signal transduction histidine kinase
MSLDPGELRAIDFFDGVEDDRLAEWAAAAEERWLEPGDVVLARGTPDTAFKLVLSGSLDGFVTRDGREEYDHTHVAPTWLGAIMAVTDEPAIITIRAAERSRVAEIKPPAFRELLFRTPVAFQRVMRTFRPVYGRFGNAEMQREKLAALGRMSAGLAHELNNPAAAATRTAAALADALDVLGGVIGEFVHSGVERADAEALVGLQRQAMAGATEERDALASADAEDEMGALLEARGVPDAWKLAEPLAAAGLDAAWLEQVAQRSGPALPAAVRWVAASLAARTLSEDLRDATDRMSALVRAIKAYSYMDQSDLQEVDVHEGIDATLTILGHKLKHTRIAVERRYAPDLPRVCVYGSELNQVWTNLLDNAIDALGQTGTITIATAPWHETGVEVTITDDGPGIPEEVQARVFEPFFTSKAVGSGTGLGLDTALRIVRDRHHGDVALTSRPGETAFTVRLPRTPQRSAGAHAGAGADAGPR